MTENREAYEYNDDRLDYAGTQEGLQHCCANHVNGQKLKEGQMLGKGNGGFMLS